MTTVKLIAIQCPTLRELGLKVDGVRTFDGMVATMDGRLIAHDIVEHQNGPGEIGSVWDELQALGGLWYTRGQFGEIVSGRGDYMDPFDVISREVDNLSRYVNVGLIRQRLVNKRVFKSSAASAFESMVEAAHEAKDGFTTEEFKIFRRYVRYHMNRGYCKAKKRFGGPRHSRYAALNMFIHIQEAVNSIKDRVVEEGQIFLLSYTTTEASCVEHYQY